MRAAGFACAGVVAVALAAFNLKGTGEDAPPSAAIGVQEASTEAPAAPPEALAAPAPGDVAAAPSPAPEPQGDAGGPPPASTAPRAEVARTDGQRRPPAPGRRRGGRSFRDDFESLPVFTEWVPPEGPVRIALQAGHWRADEAPPELSGLRNNGANGGGKAEWEVNLEIARRTAKLLEEMGYVVDVLPAVVPPAYRAHLFIAIHADGALDPAATGFRVAAPRRDPTGKAAGFAEILERSYQEATGLRKIPTVIRRMQNYYAFNSRRYEHALDPMTIGVIIETGFLTSAADRELIIGDPDRVAKGIASAVAQFPLTPPPNGGGAG